MRLNGGGQSWIEQAFSDANAFRNEDFVTANDMAFAGSVQTGAVAGEFTQIQCFNPAGSDKTVMVDGIIISSAAGNSYELVFHDTELTVDVSAFVNLRNAGAASTARLRADTNAAHVGTRILFWSQLANVPFPIKLKPAIELVAGEGLMVEDQVVNTTTRVSYFIREF